jgi:probable selenium-dependent hydroxylase accessory protein YqeC
MLRNRQHRAPGNAAAERLLDLLQARRGIVCLTGAGGKKTTLYRLAAAHPGRIAITTTVRLQPFPPALRGAAVSAPDAELLDAVPARLPASGPMPYSGVVVGGKRLSGVAPEIIAALHARCGFEATYVKADGARMRLLKAPGPHEPVLVPGTATVVPVLSVQAISRPLDERVAHRPERIAAIAGLALGGLLEPRHLAALLASEEGALQGVGDATVVPLLNMADDERLAALAHEAAAAALRLTRRFDRVVIANMTAPDPVVDVVER